MVQDCDIPATETDYHACLLRASEGHRDFRILSVISIHPADIQPEKHSTLRKENMYYCFFMQCLKYTERGLG